MANTKFTIVRLLINNDKFEILVKPELALEFKMGKKKDMSGILASDDVYYDANKGTRAASEKLQRHFKTNDLTEISSQILMRGDLNLTTDQRRKMVEEKRKQIIQYINKSFVDPRSHIPHPIIRIENAMDQVRVTIDPFKRAEDQAKMVIDSLRKILPLKSEVLRLTITVPPQFSAQSYDLLKTSGEFKGDHWLQDGSLRATVELNAGMKSNFLDRLGAITKGSAQVIEG